MYGPDLTYPAPVSGQLSFLTAGMRPAAVTDLEGFLLGGGQLVRLGGTARLSVVVEPGWRVGAALAACRDRGLQASAVPADGGVSVRTPFSRLLAPVAQRWARGAMKTVPPAFTLDGARLRLWMIVAGQPDQPGYLLQLGGRDEAVWEPAGAALASIGLPATLLGPRAAGPGYRIIGRRRLARLREYVGDPPSGAGADWPG